MERLRGIRSLDKLELYEQLVKKRKNCAKCLSLNLTNPSACAGGQYDADHIGPWTSWHGDLDADLMIVGQDWGGSDYYIDQKGIETDDNDTNINLQILLASIGYKVALPREPRRPAKLFFTNAVLCLKQGRLTGRVRSQCFINCGRAFLRPQIELVQPKVVVTLGFSAYKAVVRAFGHRPRTSMRDAVQTTAVLGRATLVPVYHCGYLGSLSRSLSEQKKDWERVAGAIEANLRAGSDHHRNPIGSVIAPD